MPEPGDLRQGRSGRKKAQRKKATRKKATGRKIAQAGKKKELRDARGVDERAALNLLLERIFTIREKLEQSVEATIAAAERVGLLIQDAFNSLDADIERRQDSLAVYSDNTQKNTEALVADLEADIRDFLGNLTEISRKAEGKKESS